MLTEAEAGESDAEAPAGGRGEREERDDWDGDGVLRRIDESLLRACMRWRSGGMMKGIEGKDIVKVTNEMNKVECIPFGSFVLDS